ncbi:hypothetical protein DID74_02190 [Candidatus Marinamargulisbacteria bacterium SCGC AG-333-B06]|nr:hypothetical protein DID74_02190 [Candidatus Marinamargulisbacteria bacterium SCGC AG-333-B06]
MNTAQIVGTGLIGLSCIALVGYTSYDVLYWAYQWIKTKLLCCYYQQKGLDFWPSQTQYHSPKTPLYITSPFGHLAPLLKSCNFLEKKTFIDCGCGKGNILIEAGKFPFKALAGIELDPTLIKICQSNLSQCGLNNKTTLYSGLLSNYETTIATYDIIYCYGVYQQADLASLCKQLASQKKTKLVIYRNLDNPAPLFEAGFYLHYYNKPCKLTDYELWIFSNKSPAIMLM